MNQHSTKKIGNILLVGNYQSDVGYAWWLMEGFWAAIAENFSKVGSKSFLIYPKITSIPKRILDAPIQVHELNFRDRTKNGINNLHEFIIKNSISIVYLTDQAYYDSLYLQMRLWGVNKIINHDHTPGQRPPAKLFWFFLKQTIHRVGFISCDHYIGVSRFVKNRLIKNACVPERKCSYVLNGIDPITPEDKCKFHAHKEFDIPKNAVVIITTGRATFHKGIDFIIECAHSIININKTENVFFLYCGSGPDLAAFTQMVIKYKLNDRFIFAGQRNDIRCLLQSSDIGIQASAGEAFSLSILEYMSAGLSTLVPDICGNGEAIKNGVNGYLYPPKGLDHVVDKLLKLIHNPSLRKQLGVKAAESVQNQFNIKRANIELVRTVKHIVLNT